MNNHNIKTSNLEQYAKNLHTISGQFNLYICLCHKKRKPDIEKLKAEIQKIKYFVINIENEINNF